MLEQVRAVLLSNLHFKVLSIVLAVVAWAFVQGDQVHEAMVTARVVWTLPPGLVSADQLPGSVTLTVRGTRAATRRARDAAITVPVDVSSSGIGDQTVELAAATPDGLPSAVELLAFSPPAVRLRLDEVALRKVSLRPVLVGEPGEGLLVEGIDLEPAVIEVQGPRSVVEPLADIATRPLDVSGLSGEATFDVQLDLPRAVRLVRDAGRMVARVKVVPRQSELVLEEVPLNVWGSHDWRPSVSRVKVTLEGPAGALREIGAGDVAAFVHLPDKPDRALYEAPYGPTEGPRMAVMHPGGEVVRVLKVTPPRVQVVRR